MPRAKPSRVLQRRRQFGERVRGLRLQQELSQEALADLVGIHRTYVGSVERGERNLGLDNIWAIADALGVSPRRLIDD